MYHNTGFVNFGLFLPADTNVVSRRLDCQAQTPGEVHIYTMHDKYRLIRAIRYKLQLWMSILGFISARSNHRRGIYLKM